ncbi:MAG: hypothetical protein LBM17_06780 [Candidatus Accumulibacter sp.]|jgi:hypothetical protein|nr:hypothetical protein [Accumulibacter sp.]
MPISAASVKFKRFRRRFGINAPRVAVRTHVPWYWYALSLVVVFALALGVAMWLYEPDARFPAFNPDATLDEIAALKKSVAELSEELNQLRVLSKTTESSFQIEHTLRQQLSSHMKQLEVENAALRQDLAFFETLMPSSMQTDEGIKVNHLRVEPGDIPGEYRYRLLAVNSFGRQTKEIKGNLQLFVEVRQDGKDAIITIPPESEPVPQRFHFEIKYFYRFEGAFSLPEGAEIKSVEARLMQNGVVRAKQSVSL